MPFQFLKDLDRKPAFHVSGYLRLFEIEIVRFFFVFVSDSRRHGGKVIRLLVVHLQVGSSGEGWSWRGNLSILIPHGFKLSAFKLFKCIQMDSNCQLLSFSNGFKFSAFKFFFLAQTAVASWLLSFLYFEM